MGNQEEKVENARNWYMQNRTIFESCTYEISSLIEKVLKQRGIIFHSITSRVKEEKSFLKKCNNDKYKNPIDQIKDVIGIRIIAHTNIEVAQICKVIRDEFSVDNDNSGNKADKLDEDKVGYLSVHFVASLNKNRKKLAEYVQIKDLCFEIQVRTLLQHTWAEIEHDKSYKFTGELRKDLKRRFYLIAGVLELMDLEFEKLSLEIDIYATEVKDKTKDGDFNITIDSTSLQEYMNNKYKFTNEISGNIISKDVIEELKRMGINTLKDIEDIVLPNYKYESDTYVGILRDFMILYDEKKYFQEAFKHNWMVTFDDIKLYRSYGIDIVQYISAEDLGENIDMNEIIQRLDDTI